MANCASAGYLHTYGTPRELADLDRYVLVHYAGTFGAEPPACEYRADGRTQTRAMRALVTVNNIDAYRAACLAGSASSRVRTGPCSSTSPRARSSRSCRVRVRADAGLARPRAWPHGASP
jgi:hypothetical protein